VGVGYCIDRIYEGREALCIHNPATGREATIPHEIPRATRAPRKVVVVGAGAAGLEAARVCAERGHTVTLFEATNRTGGQVALAARVPRRREIIGIIDWLNAEIERLGVDLRLDCDAEAGDVLAEEPDVVIVATGGTPDTGFLETGEELVTTSWDILSGFVAPAETVLLFDDNGQHPGLSCAEHIAEQGAKLELVTPDRMIAGEAGGTNYPAYLRVFYDKGVVMTPNYRLTRVRRQDDKLVATLFCEYNQSTVERHVDQVVTEHGTVPNLDALIAGEPQDLIRNPAGRYLLFRVGDAVASRNIHAAIYDSLRLCKDL
jgi:NADPH-dependent 2,4-dienoyl-CoA reductase/sulfur reductase-like enzyme